MRQPKPFYRAFNDTWYVQLGKDQVPLGKHPDGEGKPRRRKPAGGRKTGDWIVPGAILDEYHQKMAERAGAPLKEALPAATVPHVCDLFLDWSQKHNAQRTFEWYQGYLQSFCEAVGSLAVTELKPLHVTRWLDKHPDWKGSRRCAMTAVKRALNWACEQGVVTQNPLKSLTKPPAKARQRILTTAERQAVLANYHESDPFFDYLTALFETGARPGEVAKVTAAHFDESEGVWEFAEHKTAKRLKDFKPRVVVLTPKMVALTRRLVEKRPEGPLFRDRTGKPWNRNSVRCRFRRARKKLGLGNDVVAYTARHTYATDALERGVPEASVAELMGHADTTMLFRHYAKLSKKRQHLREMAERAARA